MTESLSRPPTGLARNLLPLALVVMGVAYVANGSPFMLSVGTITVIWAVLALGLNMLMGYSGLINLGVGAFYALGAYGAALLAQKSELSPWLMLLILPALAFVIGLVIGPVVLRTKGLHFAVATLGIGIVISDVLDNWVDVTQGPIGVAGIERPGVLDLGFVRIDPTETADFFVLMAGLLLVVIGIATIFHRSPVAAVLRGARDDDLLAKSLGFSVTWQRILAFACSCAVAAIAGVMYAWYMRYISPPPFSFFLASFPAFVLVAVGGPGSVWGPVVGAVFLTGFPELVDVDATTMPIIYGAVLLLVMVVLPKGLVPGGRDLFERLRHGPRGTRQHSPGSVDHLSPASPETHNGKVPTR